MNWLYWIIGGILLLIVLKIIFKALKITFILMMLSLLVLLFWLWQHGMIFK